ncbi:MAG: nodulation protein NfeD [candidate division KSB1 bacterium]|nr:nodulation protein NfeD [candidate division KSB1 bacterium]MDZ7300810.1 nodulation protein NfeD [candidate division KSB1 bacterium]MDZ7309919.1 nodulation protein NfeD [candidate division KSB1 bacterium]
MKRKSFAAMALGLIVLCHGIDAGATAHPAREFHAMPADTVSPRPSVHAIRINGPINPLAAEYITGAIDDAVDARAECLIIELDTPGGLMESTRIITKAMLASEIPVVVYVSPSGARAASAGVFITYAAHLAAMASSTNIGAAHPVNIGGTDTSKTMIEKVTNDAVAQIKAVAEKRGRNVQWAEEAVRKSVSITEKEALAKNVINFIAPNIDSLLILLDGHEVDLVNRKTKLRTAGAALIRKEMSWRHKLLDKISDPNIAYILLLLGIYGIFFELSNPGAVLPGVLGGIFLILAFYALQTLPVNWAGLLLILFAVILFILEVKVTSYGILTIGGIVSMFLGSVMLFNKAPTIFEPAIRISLQIVAVATLATAAFFAFAIGLVVKAHRKQATTGREGMIGEIGTALTNLDPEGRVQVHGEIWQARSDEPIDKGQTVRVLAISGLHLKVEKLVT